jgi:hypothetical protein
MFKMAKICISLVKNQSGKRIEGTLLYLRKNGDQFDAWNVEVCMLVRIYDKLGYYDMSNSVSYHHKSIAILDA